MKRIRYVRSDNLPQVDGERLPLVPKDLGGCDLYPQTLVHNPNGRYVTVCGDGALPSLDCPLSIARPSFWWPRSFLVDK